MNEIFGTEITDLNGWMQVELEDSYPVMQVDVYNRGDGRPWTMDFEYIQGSIIHLGTVPYTVHTIQHFKFAYSCVLIPLLFDIKQKKKNKTAELCMLVFFLIL